MKRIQIVFPDEDPPVVCSFMMSDANYAELRVHAAEVHPNEWDIEEVTGSDGKKGRVATPRPASMEYSLKQFSKRIVGDFRTVVHDRKIRKAAERVPATLIHEDDSSGREETTE